MMMLARTGSKALLVRGDLRTSIAVVMKGDEAFVGVLRSARSGSGEGFRRFGVRNVQGTRAGAGAVQPRCFNPPRRCTKVRA